MKSSVEASARLWSEGNRSLQDCPYDTARAWWVLPRLLGGHLTPESYKAYQGISSAWAPGQTRNLDTGQLGRCHRIRRCHREWGDYCGQRAWHLEATSVSWETVAGAQPVARMSPASPAPNDDPLLCFVYTRLLQGSCWPRTHCLVGPFPLRPATRWVQMNTWCLAQPPPPSAHPGLVLLG